MSSPKGGVTPFGHTTQLRVFVDPDLLQYDEVWAAAGTWNDNFGAYPNDIVLAIAGVISDPRRIRNEGSQDFANFDPSIACA